MKKIEGDKQLRSWWAAAAKLPPSRRTRVVSGARGLYARLHESGAHQWLLRFQFSGRARVLVLGRWPELSLVEARRIATAARVELDQGIDPAETRRRRIEEDAARRLERTNTVGSAAREWMAREFVGQRSATTSIRAVTRHIVEPLGMRPLNALTQAELREWLAERVAAAGPAAAQRALRYLRRLYRDAQAQRRVTYDPTLGLRPQDAGGPLRSRDRVLDDHELRQLFSAMHASERFARENMIAVELLLLTCARKMELLAAPSKEFDLATGLWEIPAERMKMGGGHVVPLTPRARKLIEELKILGGGSEMLFPTRRIPKGRRRASHMGNDTLNRALSDLIAEDRLAPFTVHDLRRTARTILAREGVNPMIAELCLGHTIKGVAGVYDRHDYLEKRREALEKLGEHIETLWRA